MHFIKLNEAEETQYRHEAREKYVPYSDICGVWHPVYQDECVKINTENALFIEKGY